MNAPASTMIQPQTTALLVVDLQDKLLPAMHDAEQCIQASARMIEAAGVLGVPIVATEQYPAGLGHTCAPVAQALAASPVFPKTRFTACVDEVLKHLHPLQRPNVIVVGIEAHVCVQQSVLDLLAHGYRPYICADAVTSRRPLDRDIAIARMRQAGAIVTTTESAIFELLGQAGTDAFKKILRIVK